MCKFLLVLNPSDKSNFVIAVVVLTWIRKKLLITYVICDIIRDSGKFFPENCSIYSHTNIEY